MSRHEARWPGSAKSKNGASPCYAVTSPQVRRWRVAPEMANAVRLTVSAVSPPSPARTYMTIRDPARLFSQSQAPKLAGVVQQGLLKAGDALARLNGGGAGHRAHNRRTRECRWGTVLATVVARGRHVCSLPVVGNRGQLRGGADTRPRSSPWSLRNMHAVHTLTHAL